MRYECDFRFGYVILLVSAGLLVSSGSAEAQLVRAEGFFKRYCLDCHQGAEAEASLDLKALPVELADPKNFARWEQLYDRVAQGEMPPKDAPQPASPERQSFLDELSGKLTAQHQSVKGTVLRRLNRREYENTLNDLFGTQERLASLLPEDGRTHEFDNVGAGLGISMVHLETYIKAMDQVLNAAIVSTIDRPAVQKIEASFKGSSESERFVGSVWKELSDGSIVRFEGGGYPSGMMRGSNIRDRGRYRVTVRGYAYRSPAAISFSVEGTSFARGSEKPVYGFFSFEPGTPEQAPQEITFEAFIETNYMLAIEPYGISDPERYKRKTVDEYEGPGLAIHSVTLEGPLIEEYPTRGHQLLFSQLQREEIMPRNPRDRERPYYRPQFNVTAQNLDQDVNAVLTEVATKAFRRPVRAEEVQPYRKLFDAEYQKENNLEQSLRTAVIALFCSPDFLYLQEPAGPLDDFAVASRLSYFLNRTAPDAELLKVAADGKLKNPQELQLQTLRLLKHPHFSRFITDYCENWLNLREMDFTNPDNSLFPEFDSYLRYSMPLETEAFLRELIEGNHGIRNLVASDFAMLNSRL
ncbi:MAG: DUF1592 domain-containing protein, partial [Planctomycetaceae bacterium]|nr:DUF1592 domain-containing protein [Planctomycetaceae bacterium]